MNNLNINDIDYDADAANMVRSFIYSTQYDKVIIMLFCFANFISFYSNSMIYSYFSLVLLLLTLLKIIILIFTVLYSDARENIFIPVIVYIISKLLFNDVSIFSFVALYVIMMIITLLHIIELKYTSWKLNIQNSHLESIMQYIYMLIRSTIISSVMIMIIAALSGAN